MQTDLLEILSHIDPSVLNYADWVTVGMALKQEGYTIDDWDNWSQSDSRYHPGECEKKWSTFKGNGIPVTGGTIVQFAKNQGWSPSLQESYELDWNDTIVKDELVIVDQRWIEGKEIKEPEPPSPLSSEIGKQALRYQHCVYPQREKDQQKQRSHP